MLLSSRLTPVRRDGDTWRTRKINTLLDTAELDLNDYEAIIVRFSVTWLR